MPNSKYPIMCYLIFLIFGTFVAGYAQSNSWFSITYPLEGSVFQGDGSNYDLPIAIQTTEPNYSNFVYALYKGSTLIQNGTIGSKSPTIVQNGSGQRIINFNLSLGASKDWFELVIYPPSTTPPINLPRVIGGHRAVKGFGIGDIYLIAGQSNASGYNFSSKTQWSTNWTSGKGMYDWTGTEDPTQPFASNRDPDSQRRFNIHKARIIALNGRWDWGADVFDWFNTKPFNDDKPIDGNWYGLPSKRGFNVFDYGTNKLSDPGYIFPNGHGSWYWQYLASEIVSKKGTPVLFFNSALEGSSLIYDWSQKEGSEYINNTTKKFLKTLKLFGSTLGIKSILWHQGEADALNLTSYNPNNNFFPHDYSSKLQSLIDYTRSVIGDISKNMSWYISKVSMFTYNSSLLNGSTTTGLSLPPNQLVPNGTYNINWNVTNYYTHSSITGQQGAILNNTNRIFEGPNTDNIVGQSRDDKFKLHFSGDKSYGSKNTLFEVGERWYNKIYEKYSSGTGLKGKEPVKIQTVEQIGNNIGISYEYIPGAKYYFTKDNKGVYSDGSRKSFDNSNVNSNSHTFNLSSSEIASATVLSCYIETADGLFRYGMPYISTSSPSSAPNEKRISRSRGFITVNQSGEIINEPIIVENINIQISSPNWIVVEQILNEFMELTLKIEVSPNSSSARSGNIIISEIGGGLSTTITINQDGTGSSTSLPTLTPINSSSEWSGFGSTRFDGKSIDGNTMQVSGTPYYQGIGTHANSRIVYNLGGGGYSTFTGLVGRDDESDNGWDGGKVVFSVKTDGSTVWTSNVHGNTSGVQSFSINVAGKSTLELIVDKYNDEHYGDHANWMDVYLSGGGGSSCSNAAPTDVSASPFSHGPGGGNTTLTASCSSGATVQWSTGDTGNSVTVFTGSTTTYTAKCVSGSCTESSPISVTVTVGGCSGLTNDLVMGYWTVTGHALVAKQFHGSWWLVQKINNSPEQFLVRGSEMLTRGDVSLTNGTYSTMVSCFAYTYSNYGGLQPPSSVTFPTPSGYSLGYEPDGTPYYTASGTPPSGCTDAYLTNTWTYASAAGSTGSSPKIGLSFEGNAMTMGSVNYTASYPGSGIGTHATSEIIYDLGASHSYTHFKSTVGKDNEAVCGEDRLVFKVYNNATNALLATSPVVGTPSYGLPQTAEMSVGISGVRYLKLVVEDGGDNIYCDHANWARARLACSASGRVAATDTTFFTVYPNVSQGEFTVNVDLKVAEEVTVSLISSSGAVYRQESYRGVKGKNALKFDAGKVMTGLYHVRVSTRERVEAKTVMIEK